MHKKEKKTPRLYIVKEIIAHKIARGRSAFLVVWRDYPDENTWEPFCVVSRLDAFRLYCRNQKIVARTASIRIIKKKETPPLLYKDDEITEEDPDFPPIPMDDAVPYDSDTDSVAKVRPPAFPPFPPLSLIPSSSYRSRSTSPSLTREE